MAAQTGCGNLQTVTQVPEVSRGRYAERRHHDSVMPDARTAEVAPRWLRLSVGGGALLIPWLVVIALAGSGPPGYARLVAAGIGAAMAALAQRRALRRGNRAGGTLPSAARFGGLVVLASFALGASVTATAAGIGAGVTALAGLTIIRHTAGRAPQPAALRKSGSS
jgi:hypothetical protein